jgi:MOB kinase activator 1
MKSIFNVSVFRRQRSGTRITVCGSNTLLMMQQNRSPPSNNNVQSIVLDNTSLGQSDQQLIYSVKQPPDESLPEWLSHHIEDFSTNISLLVNTIQPCCTPLSCPKMTAGPSYVSFTTFTDKL